MCVCFVRSIYISPGYEWQTTYHQHIIVYFHSHHLNVLDAGQVGTLDDELEAGVGLGAGGRGAQRLLLLAPRGGNRDV